MSGIEVAGILLGIFPLIISALEHYSDACKLKGFVSQFKSEYGKTLDDVKDEQLSFHQNLEVLLVPLIGEGECDTQDIESFLASSDIPGSSHADVSLLLQDRLGRSHERFLEIVRTLHSQLSALLTTLVHDKPRLQAKLQEDHVGGAAVYASRHRSDKNQHNRAAVPKRRLSASALQDFLKNNLAYRKEQAKFGFGKKQRDHLLNEVHRNNEKLEKLLDKTEKIASYKASSTTSVSPKAVQSLLRYWKDADRVYTLLHKSWGCNCKQKHCAQLWLQHRTSATFEFKLLVLWAPRSIATGPTRPWDRQGLRVTYLEGQMVQHLPLAPSGHQPTSTAPVSILSKDRIKRRRGTQGVQFAAMSSPVVHISQTATSGSPIGTPNKSVLPAAISELCAAMTSCGMQAACIGALDDDNGGKQYSVYAQPEQKFAAEEITLHEVLVSDHNPWLTRSHRFRIALAVASSHLQLQSTSWARKQWEAADITFPYARSRREPIMFDKPYVSADFAGSLSSSSSLPKTTDRIFACLGIMMLELLFGRCLENHKLWDELGLAGDKTKPLARLMIAKQWAEEVEGEAGPDFAAAVNWCLDKSPSSLDGNEWRRDLADRVVLPLQNCCDWMQAKTRPPSLLLQNIT